jgi:hypothetical protein
MPQPCFETLEIISKVHSAVNPTASVRYFDGLLMHPNQPFNPTVLRHAEDLEYYNDELEFAVVHKQYEHIRLGTPDAAQPKVDRQTIADCIKRLTFLNGKLDEANGHADSLAIAAYTKERTFIIKFLGRSRDKHGKPYDFKTMRESDYRCVHKALMRLIDKVRESDSNLADYIKTHLSTGMCFMWWE